MTSTPVPVPDANDIDNIRWNLDRRPQGHEIPALLAALDARDERLATFESGLRLIAKVATDDVSRHIADGTLRLAVPDRLTPTQLLEAVRDALQLVWRHHAVRSVEHGPCVICGDPGDDTYDRLYKLAHGTSDAEQQHA